MKECLIKQETNQKVKPCSLGKRLDRMVLQLHAQFCVLLYHPAVVLTAYAGTPAIPWA